MVCLTDSQVIDDWPAWSPDGGQIVFTSSRDGAYEIFIMYADGSNPVNLSNHPASDFDPAWSPLLASP